RVMAGLTAVIALGGFAAGVPARILLLAALGLWSGGFFPRLLHAYRDRIGVLLVCDGIGAVIAAALALMLPLVLGIDACVAAVALIGAATAFLVRRASPARAL